MRVDHPNAPNPPRGGNRGGKALDVAKLMADPVINWVRSCTAKYSQDIDNDRRSEPHAIRVCVEILRQRYNLPIAGREARRLSQWSISYPFVGDTKFLLVDIMPRSQKETNDLSFTDRRT